VPAMPDGARAQIDALTKAGDPASAALIRDEASTPSGTWLTGGSAAQAQQQVRQVTQAAAATRTVPTLVVYNVPGRDCGLYSSGGASSDAAYTSWIDGVARGLIRGQRVVVVIEPDGLSKLPSDCPAAFRNAGTYPNPARGTATAGRIADIRYAARAVTAADPSALVYLDAGNSAWHAVGDISARLQDAGVADTQGFALDTANHQYTANASHYGTWISDCLAYTRVVKPGDFRSCGHQYWSGGPANAWTGTSLDPRLQWSDTATATTANTAGVTSRYAALLGSVRPTAHFVIDTSRNGAGPWSPPADRYRGDPQTWCNPPGARLGQRPTARPQPTAFPLLDAALWIKTPGQSDGRCTRSVPGATTDPEWGGIADPAAGAWFPQQALQLAQPAPPRR
jgi:endoglucanase